MWEVSCCGGQGAGGGGLRGHGAFRKNHDTRRKAEAWEEVQL